MINVELFYTFLKRKYKVKRETQTGIMSFLKYHKSKMNLLDAWQDEQVSKMYTEMFYIQLLLHILLD